MKRRRFLQTITTVSAASAVQAQQNPSAPRSAAAPQTGEPAARLDLTAADAAAEPVPRFFSKEQFAALQRLSELLLPAMDGNPGAGEAEAPEFLDFLISESPAERQRLYTAGLDALNLQSAVRFGKAFSAADDSQAHQLLAPLREPWTPEPPADPLAHFLREAKEDVRTATVNSQPWSVANADSGGGRRRGRRGRGGGAGLYWYTIE
jgi:hypothetical protein